MEISINEKDKTVIINDMLLSEIIILLQTLYPKNWEKFRIISKTEYIQNYFPTTPLTTWSPVLPDSNWVTYSGTTIQNTYDNGTSSLWNALTN